MTRLTRASAALAALAALAVAWLVAPAGVPLYDGVGFPDEPYRYVQPPAGYRQTPPPTGAQAEVPADHGGNSRELEMSSGESGPQVIVYVPKRYLLGAATAKKFQMRATPVAPEGTVPDTGRVDGNVYRITAGAQPAGQATVRSAADQERNAGEIDLRAVAATTAKVSMNYRPNPTAPWQSLHAIQVGNEIYASTLVGLGDYVLTVADRPGKAAGAAAGGSGSSTRWPVIALVALVLLCAGALVAVRVHRGRRR